LIGSKRGLKFQFFLKYQDFGIGNYSRKANNYYLRKPSMNKKRRLSSKEYINGIQKGDRVILSRAITLIESAKKEDLVLAEEILSELLPQTGKSIRIGITGVPGVGKSTFIEAFGSYITSQGKKLAVLTVDPSSLITKGSILGDKTRMEELSRNPDAFIRPSAAGGTLGGVTNKTREVILLCEAAGYDVVFVETVGVGQSETQVKGMVDFFLLLMLAGAGDELQGIKKGIMEMADGVAINKADGDNLKVSKIAKMDYQNALHLFPASESGWIPEVKTCSALKEIGIEDIWEMIEKHNRHAVGNGFFESNRKKQQVDWVHEHVVELLKQGFYQSKKVKIALPSVLGKVASGDLPALNAANQLIDLLNNK
jgi:LAO/AO transport system kinase